MSEEYSILKKCTAECVGTFMIVAGGCGMVCACKYANYPMGPLGIPVVFGMAVTMAVYTTRDISGAHLNPAVTASLAINKPEACPKEIIVPYVASQMLGATLAGALNYVIYNNGIKDFEKAENIVRGTKGSIQSYNGAFGMIPNKRLAGKNLTALMLEVGMTSALLFTIFALTDPKKSVPSAAAPALIGTTVTALASQFAPVTGCGMNPARDLGPRLVTAATGWGAAAWHPAWWVYSVGPVAGAILGGAAYNTLMTPDKKKN